MKHSLNILASVRLHQVILCSVTPLHTPAYAAPITFLDEAAAAGLATPGESYGASWGDLNGDGYADLFVSNHRQQPTVYVNRRDGAFHDSRAQVFPWVNRSEADTHGGTWSDFDGDGDQDLLITTGTGNDQQMLVNERGDLVDRTQELGIEVENVGGRMALWLDYDRDARMDFVAIQFGGVAQLFRQASTGFVNATIGSNLLCKRIQYGHLLDVDGDGALDIVCAHDARFPRKVYSTTTFPMRDITDSFPPVESVVDSIVADFENNGALDVFFVSGVQLRPSGASQATPRQVEALLQNGKKGLSFASAGRVTVQLDWNRLDRVGPNNVNPIQRIVVGSNRANLVSGTSFTLDANDPDVQGVSAADPSKAPELRVGYDTAMNQPRWVFVIDSVAEDARQIFSEAYLQITAEDRDITALASIGLWNGDSGGIPRLMLNDGGAFHDATADSGLGELMSCVSVAAGDFDNDMDVDLYLACSSGASNIVNRYYDNNGNGTFTRVAGAGGASGPLGTSVFGGAGTADSGVVADYDNDGFLDLFVNNGLNLRPKGIGGPSSLFRNRGNGNRWLHLDLVGTRGTRDAVGAVVQVTAFGVTQARVVDGGYHRWSQNHGRLHFGLGAADRAAISIRWPDGTVESHPDVAANGFYTATEDGALASTPPGSGVPYACGEPAIDASVDRGVYVWKECYQNVWRVRFGAAGGSTTYSGRIVADAPIESVNAVGLGSVLDLSDPSTLVFEITEARARLNGFNLLPGAGAVRHCLRVPTPAGTSVFYGPLKERLSSSELLLEAGTPCSNAPVVEGPAPPDTPQSPVCGDPGLDPALDAAFAIWRNCPGADWQIRASAGGISWSVFDGTIDSSTGFAGWAGDSLESTDVLTLAPWTRLYFGFALGPPWYDGLWFTPSADAEVCVSLDLPAGVTVVVGSEGAQPASPSFSLTSIEPCAT